MSNFTLTQLLQMTPLEALLIAYNETHGTQLNPRFVEVDRVIGSTGQQLSVRLKARSNISSREHQRFIGSGEFVVNRLNLSDLFTTPVQIPYSEAISSPDVGRNITQITGIVFDDNDFVKDVITVDNNVIQAHPESLRWYGEMTVEKT
ncbi:hypothetical protein D9M68_17900 [compost metagenome]